MAAGALLVAVVAADATMNRTYKLEAYLDGRWILVASTPEDVMTREFPSLVPLPLNASDDVSFRLSAHNGYPWSLSKDFDLTVGGVSVQRGALDASSFQDDREEFTVPASALMTQGAGFPAEKPPPGNERFWSPQILLEVDGETLYGSVAFREVAR
jgi:hypothetical protein